ncbi:LytR/AlgR family response regulator transcription factor [Fictibacillus fluitans]|uniref:LytTR family DNA-binding domain-containing protein n=1 Tax=Fictibacillus fluitans TaxID=3058422 RepID=A0ABT8I075_9BACL|nr:LytTR family DNA-binding domain-containing protein [Fictibacillus sp. NE201]MDN4526436.1 LytTR family DNA-binding domain-containing protein [Fictibacillus sp. NE201]
MKGPIKALIVDDERFSREELIYLLKAYESIDIVGEADSGDEALMKAIQLQPDVIFLDVEMPRMDGMQVARSLQELKKVPAIVFGTAYPDFAVEAFRHEAVDYLLKPFEEEQLGDAIARLEKKLMPTEPIPSRESKPSKLAVEKDEEIHYLDPANILYVYRDDRLTKIVGKDHVYETKWALKEVEERLREFPFFRIHKSYLVNLDYVARLIPWFNGAYELELRGSKDKLSVSRNYVKELRKQLEL